MAAMHIPSPGCERTPCEDPRVSWPGWYWPTLVVALFLVFSMQKFVQVRQVLRIPHVHLFEVENRGHTKQWLGVCISLVFFALLVEFATAMVARRVVRLLP